NVLAAFLFTGDDVFKLIGDLSGGERGRVSLAKLMLGNANFLILDEPTNHMDIASKEILEDALNQYTGTVLYVSHDRYFINRTAHRILELTQNHFVNYIGNYDYYLEKHEDHMNALDQEIKREEALLSTSKPSTINDANEKTASSGAQDWKAKKEEAARIRKKENDLKKCEEKIAQLEARIAEIDEEMSDPEVATKSLKLQELTKEQEELRAQLEQKYEEWETLAE
ncbi:MAG: ABC-F family ATP-binding cassette domain-containing protein, partial [Lachnospiraceae bacterium]|nr:ABC-F family ATP-binding cassette domain-containing protein [Lachnospiraceae bacterium]